MTAPQITLAMIVRDEESTLEALLQSARPHVDRIVIADTGSSDRTPEIARKYADRWELFLGANNKDGLIEDFALARNYSFSLIDTEWAFWLDGDDLLHGGEHLRELASLATADNHTYLFPYEYSRDAAGNITCLQYRERLMRPASAQVWNSPVHEYCSVPDPKGDVLTVATERVRVEHRSAQSKKVREPQRNLRILRDYVKRIGEKDVRALYYLGVEYAMAGEVGQSQRFLKRYAELADWDDEKCKALLAIGEHYRNIGFHDDAVAWSQKAMITKSWPEPWFAMGRSFYAMASRGERPDYNFKRAAYHFKLGLDHPTDVVLFANPMERYEVHSFLNVCYHALGDNEKAIWSCEEGLKGWGLSGADWKRTEEFAPGSPQRMLLGNLDEYVSAKLRSTVMGSIGELEQRGRITEAQAVVMRATLKGELRLELPGEFDRNNGIPQLGPAPSTLQPQTKADGKLDIALFLGPALERWTPETWAKTGMGGSETMAWEMARRLRKLGNRVRFYADCEPGQQGVYEGVEWVQWERFRGVECDVLIASRFPWAVDDEVTVNTERGAVTIGGCKATARLLYVHDVHCGDQLNLQRMQRIDRFLVLSKWHHDFFRQVYTPPGAECPIPLERMVVTRNGIDLARFEPEADPAPRAHWRAVFSSSPDRGLLAAVTAWPRVRDQVPNAELHVYYGFGNWEKSAEMKGDPNELGQIAHLKRLAETTQGVVLHERVNQRELAREFMRAGVWAYPTWFSETSCITAMEAQASGLCVVTSKIAALAETVKSGTLIDWESDSQTPTPDYIDTWVDEVARCMTEDVIERRETAMRLARESFGLDELAAEWSEMLEGLVADLTENPVPKFSAGKVAAE